MFLAVTLGAALPPDGPTRLRRVRVILLYLRLRARYPALPAREAHAWARFWS